MRLLTWIVISAAIAGDSVMAQTTTNAQVSLASNPPPALVEAADERAWAFSLVASTYFVPKDRDYVQPTLTADRGWLHLEARYNYEDQDTGSVWIGYNFSAGDKLALEFTPMLGGVFGETEGLAPGYKGSLSWWKLELYSEAEYVFDTRESDDSYFYTWTELSLAPADWFRFGLVVQRTRAYETDAEVQPGFLIGCTYRQLDLTAYVFDSDEDEPLLVLGVGLSF